MEERRFRFTELSCFGFRIVRDGLSRGKSLISFISIAAFHCLLSSFRICLCHILLARLSFLFYSACVI